MATSIRASVLQVLVLTYSLTAGAFQSNPPSVTEDLEGVIRLGIAVAAGMLGLIVRDLSARRNERSLSSIAADVIVIYGLVLVSQQLHCLPRHVPYLHDRLLQPVPRSPR
jgi:hypothetical protein